MLVNKKTKMKIILPILAFLFSYNAMSSEFKDGSKQLSITQEQELSRIMRRTGLSINDPRLLSVVPADIYKILNQKKLREAEEFIPKEKTTYNLSINKLHLKLSGHNLVGARLAHTNTNVAGCVESSCEVDEIYLKSIIEAKRAEDRYFVNYCVKKCLYGYADAEFDHVTANNPCQTIVSISSTKNKRVFRLDTEEGIFYIEAPRSSKTSKDRDTTKSTSRITYVSSFEENERHDLRLGALVILPSNLLFTVSDEVHTLDPILTCASFKQLFQDTTYNIMQLKAFLKRSEIY